MVTSVVAIASLKWTVSAHLFSRAYRAGACDRVAVDGGIVLHLTTWYVKARKQCSGLRIRIVAESLTLPRKVALRYDPESGSLFGLRLVIDSSNACAVEEVGAQADRPSGEVAA